MDSFLGHCLGHCPRAIIRGGRAKCQDIMLDNVRSIVQQMARSYRYVPNVEVQLGVNDFQKKGH